MCIAVFPVRAKIKQTTDGKKRFQHVLLLCVFISYVLAVLD